MNIVHILYSISIQANTVPPESLLELMSDDDGESNYSVDSEHWLDDAEDFFDNEYMEEEEIDFEDWNKIMWTVLF